MYEFLCVHETAVLPILLCVYISVGCAEGYLADLSGGPNMRAWDVNRRYVSITFRRCVLRMCVDVKSRGRVSGVSGRESVVWVECVEGVRRKCI